jgi:ferredoxin
MAQIFRKGSNSIARVTLLTVFFGFLGFWGVVYAVYRSPYTTNVNLPREQVVPFSHRHHVSGLGIDCRYCHTTVEKSDFAGLPATHICMSCHSQIWTGAPMLAPVRQSMASGHPLEWNRVNDTPDFVFFNHSIHVTKGIGCSTCHGRVDEMPLTWKAHSLYMRWCLDCHEAPEQHLRPKDEIYNMKWEPPPDQAERGKKLTLEYGLDRARLEQLRDCGMCHR